LENHINIQTPKWNCTCWLQSEKKN